MINILNMLNDQIKQKTIVAQVMEAMRDLIASGEYVPGDKIPTEAELAEKFGVGRSSIREAVKIFNYLGVLDSRAAMGTFVQERSQISREALRWSLLLGEDEFEKLVDFRGAIELWCMLSFAEAMINKRPEILVVVNDLKDIVDTMKDAAKKEIREELVECDYRFHHTIVKSAQKPLFLSLYETLGAFLHDEMRRSQAIYTDLNVIPYEHNHLLECLITGDTNTILNGYIKHIENIKNCLRKG